MKSQLSHNGLNRPWPPVTMITSTARIGFGGLERIFFSEVIAFFRVIIL